MKKILIALALLAVYAVTGGIARRTLPAKGVPAAGRDAASLAARITPIVKADSSAVPDEAALADLYDQTLAAYQAEMDELTLDQLFERFGKYAEGSERSHIIVEELGYQFACKMADYEVMIASLAPDLPAEGSITFVEDERSAAAVAQSPIACALYAHKDDLAADPYALALKMIEQSYECLEQEPVYFPSTSAAYHNEPVFDGDFGSMLRILGVPIEGELDGDCYYLIHVEDDLLIDRYSIERIDDFPARVCMDRLAVSLGELGHYHFGITDVTGIEGEWRAFPVRNAPYPYKVCYAIDDECPLMEAFTFESDWLSQMFTDSFPRPQLTKYLHYTPILVPDDGDIWNGSQSGVLGVALHAELMTSRYPRG